MLPNLALISNLVHTCEDYEVAQSGMNKILEQLLAWKKLKTEVSMELSQDTSVASFPSIDKRDKDVRKKPFTSPSNFNKK